MIFGSRGLGFERDNARFFLSWTEVEAVFLLPNPTPKKKGKDFYLALATKSPLKGLDSSGSTSPLLIRMTPPKNSESIAIARSEEVKEELPTELSSPLRSLPSLIATCLCVF